MPVQLGPRHLLLLIFFRMKILDFARDDITAAATERNTWDKIGAPSDYLPTRAAVLGETDTSRATGPKTAQTF